MRFRAFTAIAVATTTLGLAIVAHAGPDEVLAGQEKACQANVAYLRGRVDSIAFWSGVFAISGALTAAVGSGLAGFLDGDRQRKAAAIVGALGAFLTFLPRALPDKADFQAKLAAADKHHTVGVKFQNQFVFAEPTESLTEAQKYVVARFSDCAALDPPSAVPDFPISKPDTQIVFAPDSARPVPVAPAATPSKEERLGTTFTPHPEPPRVTSPARVNPKQFAPDLGY